MKYLIIKRIVVIIFLFNFVNILGQSFIYENSSTPDQVTTLNFQHTSFTKQDVGSSLIYNFPGFLSDFGSLTYNYKNDDYDSYYGSLGSLYLLVGGNKSIAKMKLGMVYLNGSIGLSYGVGNLLGNFGISLYNSINRTSSYEISTNIFVHGGSKGFDGVYAPVSTDYTRGIVGSIIYSFNIMSNFTASISTGIAYYQVEALQNYRNFFFVASSEELEDHNLWVGYTIIPWGFTISLKI